MRLRPIPILVVFLLAGQCQAGAIITGTTVSNDTTLPGFFTSPFPAGGSATVSGFAANTNYTGENYVVGPVVNGKVVSYNLKSYNGMDFLINDKFGTGSDKITVHFSFPIYSLSFDYEIFPNANVPNTQTGQNPGNTPNWPDITVTADGHQILHAFGVIPGPGTFGYTASPNNATETAPQFIGSSGLILFPGGVTTLEFIDWPPVIGVNNLEFGDPATPVPEPATMAIFGLCAAGAGIYGFRRRKKPAA